LLFLQLGPSFIRLLFVCATCLSFSAVSPMNRLGAHL
jgi:hypothetical protein